MRIALVVPSLRAGGAERVSITLAGAFDEDGHDVVLVVLDPEGPLRSEVPSGVGLVELGVRSVHASFPALVRALRRFGPDLIVSHLTHLNVAVAAVRLAVARKSKVLVVEHNVWLSDRDTTLRRDRLARVLARILYPTVHGVVAVSEAVATSLGRAHPHLRATVIPNPIPIDRIRMLAISVPAPDVRRPLVLAAGRLVHQKHFSLLLDALAQVQGEPSLVILGDGPERSALEDRIEELGLSDRVSIPGTIGNPYPWIAVADLIVSSSRFEGLPTVLIEALILGRSVVATNCPGGTAEVLGDGRYGILVPADDAAQLAAGIEQALLRGGSAVGEEATTRYRPDQVATRYLRAAGV